MLPGEYEPEGEFIVDDWGSKVALAVEKLAACFPVDAVRAGVPVIDAGGKSPPGKLNPPEGELDFGVKGNALTAVLAAWLACCPIESFIAAAPSLMSPAPGKSIDVGMENPPTDDDVDCDALDGIGMFAGRVYELLLVSPAGGVPVGSE